MVAPSREGSVALPQPEADPPKSVTPAKSRVAVLVYRGIGVIAVALGTAGVFLPLLPTTIFLIVAAWAFARSSPEWADRLRAHPRLGPPLVAWETRGAIPTTAKAMAVTMMAASWAIVALTVHQVYVVGGVAVLLVAVASYVVTRPSA